MYIFLQASVEGQPSCKGWSVIEQKNKMAWRIIAGMMIDWKIKSDWLKERGVIE